MLKRLLSEVWGKRPAAARPQAAPAASDADGRFRSGEEARKRKDLASAESEYRRALRLDAGHADAWLGLGLCHFAAGELARAHVCISTAASLRSRDADILNELGMVEHAMGNLSVAQGTFEKAVNMNAEHPEAWNNLGLVHGARGRARHARRCFLRAISIRPDFYTALCNLGLACQQLELFDEAQQYLNRAVAVRPQAAAGWLNLGSVFQDMERLDEARDALEAALRAAPRDPDVLVALGSLSLRRGEPDVAEQRFHEALALQPSHADAGLGLAQVQLARGDFFRGWDAYEARLRARNSPARPYPYPEWGGQPLHGRRLLIYGEQGIGDEILFASCLPDVLRDAAQVFLACNPRLRGLFARSFPQLRLLEGFEGWNPESEGDLAGIDFRVAIGSLMRLYRRSHAAFPRHQGYLVADAARVARWRERVRTLGDGRRVGLAWRGGRASTGRAARSLSLREMAPLLRMPGVHWVSVQHSALPEELEEARRSSGVAIHHWPEAHQDLDDTAALLCALDACVAVCSSVVHLGGALGRPVLVLTPRAPAWRYLLEGGTLPWYPSVTLYRQGASSGWSDALDSLAEGLRAMRPA